MRATDRAGNYAEVRVVVTMIGNKKGPEWIFPAFNGDKIVVCEVCLEKYIKIVYIVFTFLCV